MKESRLFQIRDLGPKLLVEVSNLSEDPRVPARVGCVMRYKLGQVENMIDELVEAVNNLNGVVERQARQIDDYRDYCDSNDVVIPR